ncbi:MAG TPA: hypothetical protein VNF07_04730 [Acidimicrobiales bacterium]|nr:hypothetical protein [Acidimicrobiales bacterium]
MTPCPECGEVFDPAAHQQTDGYARCPACGHQFLADIEEHPTVEPQGDQVFPDPAGEPSSGGAPPLPDPGPGGGPPPM